MNKKLNNKTLFLILIALLAIYGISHYISSKRGENTFRTILVKHLDTSKVASVYIYTREKKGHPIHLFLQGRKWMVSQDENTSIAEERSANYIMEQLQQLDPDRLASNDVNQWKDYLVTDTSGTRIVMLGTNKDTIIDVIVGKFGFMPQQKKGISYVRINGQNEVYGVEGFLSMNISKDFDSWRNRKIIFPEFQTYKALTFTYPDDSGYTVKKDSAGNWRFDDGKTTDSLGAVNTIGTIARQNYGSFVNKFDTNAHPALFILKVEAVPFGTFLVKAYPAADTINKYVITSTLDPGSYFSGSKSDLFNKIFAGKYAFLHHTEPKKSAGPPPPMSVRKVNR